MPRVHYSTVVRETSPFFLKSYCNSAYHEVHLYERIIIYRGLWKPPASAGARPTVGENTTVLPHDVDASALPTTAPVFHLPDAQC